MRRPWPTRGCCAMKREELFKFMENVFEQEVEEYVLRYMNSLILFGVMKNCLNNGRSQSLWHFIKMVIQQTVVIIKAYHC
jgi:hypothetical protein